MKRDSAEMKLWLFDLAHGNLTDAAIMKGFIQYYVLHDCTISEIQQDIVYHTTYGELGCKTAIESLKRVLKEFSGDNKMEPSGLIPKQ